jgi:phosphatidylglycerophosphate synthase
MAGAIIAAVIGGIVLGIGWIWFVVTAFRESTSQGLLCLFVPFYAIYYAIKRWSDVKKIFFIYLVGVVILIVGLVGSCTQIMGDVEPVIARFMEAGAANNTEAAYACWSTQMYSEQDIAQYIESYYDDLFAGYERLDISGFQAESSGGITVCDVSGVVIYTGGESLPFEASLVKMNDVWKLTYIYIGY